MISILLVEDNPGDYRLLQETLKQANGLEFAIDWADSVDRARVLIDEDRHDIGLVDYSLGPDVGLDVLEHMQARNWDAPYLLLTNHRNEKIDFAAMHYGASDYLIKNEIEPQQLERTLRYAIRRHSTERSLRLQAAELELQRNLLETEKARLSALSCNVILLSEHLANADRSSETTFIFDDTATPSLELLESASAVGICEVTLDGTIRQRNPAAIRILGGETGALLPDLIVCDQRPAIRNVMDKWRAGVGQSTEVLTIGNSQSAGHRVLLTGSPLADRDGRIARLLLTIVDISERREQEDQLSRMAHRDALTGLYNRAMFDEALQHQLAQAMRIDAQFAVLYIDLDKFKQINDRLGHAAGDELLRETAQRLQDGTRASDFVARLGGDEFGVILANLGSRQDAQSAVAKLNSALNRPYAFEQQILDTRASIGVALFPDDGNRPAELVRSADMALYSAKARNRGGVCYAKGLPVRDEARA